MSNKKPMFIFVEGVDRAGKGSLIEAIHKATNYKHVIFDRGIISNMAYSIIYDRLSSNRQSNAYKEYLSLERQMKKLDHLVIYVDCKNEELEKRCIETNHEKIDYIKHKQIFNSIYVTSVLNIHRVDSTEMTPEQIAQQLIEQDLI